VFIALRLCEDDGAACHLKDALEAAGISAFLCGDTSVGNDIAVDIARALDVCELFVALGTKSFGVQGDSSMSTRQELLFAVNNNKPIFLIKRCDEFEDATAREYLSDVVHHEWHLLTDIPGDLVDNIKTKLDDVAREKQLRAA
jgi:hypothetical protein